MFKFYLNNQEYTPVNIGELSIDINLTTDAGAYYYEYLLNGSPMYKGAAYKFIRKHSDGQKIEFKITEQNDTGVYQIYKGKFTNRACTDNEDDKIIECEISTDSLYRRLVDNYDKTFNMLLTPNIVSSQYESTGSYEYLIRVQATTAPPDEPLFGSYIEASPGGVSPFVGFLVYARERQTTYSVGSKPQKPKGDRWELYIDQTESKSTSTWVRKPDVFISPVINNSSFADTTAIPPLIPPVPPVTAANEDWYNMGTISNPFVSVSLWIDFNVLRQEEQSLNNGRLLVDVINYGLNQDVPELDVQSQFLTQIINPVNGETPSTTQDIQIHAIGDIKDPAATEPAQREDVRLRDILEGYISGKLNCFWRPDERTKRLIIENYKNVFSQNVINVTQDQKIRKYSHDNTDIPRSEEFPSEDSAIDFTGVPIEYDNEVAKNVKTYNVDKFYSEVESIIENPESYPKDGYVMITKDSLKIDDPLSEVGKITGNYAPNMPQSMGVLHDKFFPYYRPFGSGLLNFNNTSFFENRPIKKLVEIDKKLCSFYFFDPYSRFEGKNFNKGYLKTANYNLSSKIITLNIQYNE